MTALSVVAIVSFGAVVTLLRGPLSPVVGLDEGGEAGADEEDAGEDRVGDAVVLQAVQHALADQGAHDAEHLEMYPILEKTIFCTQIVKCWMEVVVVYNLFQYS